MNLTYVEAWLLALALTQLAEVPVYRWLARVDVWRALSLSFVTHPLVWFVIPPLCTSAGLDYPQMIVVAELFAWTAEAALLRVYGVRWPRALLVAFAANAASVLLGMATRHWLGVP